MPPAKHSTLLSENTPYGSRIRASSLELETPPKRRRFASEPPMDDPANYSALMQIVEALPRSPMLDVALFDDVSEVSSSAGEGYEDAPSPTSTTSTIDSTLDFNLDVDGIVVKIQLAPPLRRFALRGENMTYAVHAMQRVVYVDNQFKALELAAQRPGCNGPALVKYCFEHQTCEPVNIEVNSLSYGAHQEEFLDYEDPLMRPWRLNEWKAFKEVFIVAKRTFAKSFDAPHGSLREHIEHKDLILKGWVILAAIGLSKVSAWDLVDVTSVLNALDDEMHVPEGRQIAVLLKTIWRVAGNRFRVNIFKQA